MWACGCDCFAIHVYYRLRGNKMIEYKAKNGTKVTFIDGTLTCIRKGLVMIFPNVQMQVLSEIRFIAKNNVYVILPVIKYGEIESFNIVEV